MDMMMKNLKKDMDFQWKSYYETRVSTENGDDYMRLEYNENQEKELRITEIEAILENELYENDVEEHCLEIELQFLQGNENTYGEPYAFIGTDNVSFDVIYEYENNRYSATLYDKNGNPQLPYLSSENLEELIGQILKIKN